MELRIDLVTDRSAEYICKSCGVDLGSKHHQLILVKSENEPKPFWNFCSEDCMERFILAYDLENEEGATILYNVGVGFTVAPKYDYYDGNLL